MSSGVGHRRSSDRVLQWLWCRLVATAPIRLLAWEPPYAAGVALKRPKKKLIHFLIFNYHYISGINTIWSGCVHLYLCLICVYLWTPLVGVPLTTASFPLRKLMHLGFLSFPASVLIDYIPRKLHILSFHMYSHEMSKIYMVRAHFAFTSTCENSLCLHS